MGKPNILLVFADQLRAHELSCMGGPVPTPNLDRLASEGILFSNAIANCPVCTPSRGSLLTGKYPLSHGAVVNDLALPEGQPTLATAARAAGYSAGYIGKWHLDGIPRNKFTPPGPRRAGFDDYWAAFECHHNYLEPKYYLDDPELVIREGYEPEIQTELAIEFMKGRDKKPFLLALSWGPPHAPYRCGLEEDLALFDPEEVALRPNVVDPRTEEIAGYQALTASLDRCMGTLMAYLDGTGLAENTYLVFTSDHGDMLYSHGRVKKQQPWEESIRIPLIMRGPSIQEWDAPCASLVGVTDLAPTVLGLAGIEGLGDSAEGEDLSEGILGDSVKARTSIPIMDIVPSDQAKIWGGKEWRGVRTPSHTYARTIDEEWVLYNNREDPFQTKNLIGREKEEETRKHLEEELQDWLKRLKDPFCSGEEHLRSLGLLEAWQERQRHFQQPGRW